MSTQLNKLATPFASIRQLPFDEYVKRFTAGITRIHIHDTYYEQTDFAPGIWDFFEGTQTTDKYNNSLIDHNNIPAVYKHLSLDTPGKPAQVLAMTHNDVDLTPEQKKQKERVWDKLLDVGMDDEEWFASFPDITYRINSLGLRTDLEVDDLVPNEFIPVFGCSHTFGLGMPAENLWHNKLSESLPIFNVGICGSGIMDVYLLLTQLYNEKPFNKAYAVIPHNERMSQVSKKGIIEGGAHAQASAFLNEFKGVDDGYPLQTQNMILIVVQEALENFCKANNIELVMYSNFTVGGQLDYHKWGLLCPPIFRPAKAIIPKLETVNPKKHTKEQILDSVARDKIHYGHNWHRKIAEILQCR